MDEDLVEVAEYTVDRNIINQCANEGRELTKKDVETVLQQILKDNGIECKTKLEEKWNEKITGEYVEPKYNLVAEIYVYKKDYDMARKLLEESKYI